MIGGTTPTDLRLISYEFLKFTKKFDCAAKEPSSKGQGTLLRVPRGLLQQFFTNAKNMYFA